MSESPIKRSGTATANVAIASDEAAACWTTNITLTNEQFERYMLRFYASESLLATLLKAAEARWAQLDASLETMTFDGTATKMAQAMRAEVMHDLCEVLREAMKMRKEQP